MRTLMTNAIQELVIREVIPADAGEITGRPAFLRGVRAHLEANDSRDRYRYPRHGNTCRAVLREPGGPAMRSMWRRADAIAVI